jgi:hypothetical protein
MRYGRVGSPFSDPAYEVVGEVVPEEHDQNVTNVVYEEPVDEQ